MTAVPRRRPRGQLPEKAASPDIGSVFVLADERHPDARALVVGVLGRPAPQGSKGPTGQESNPRTRPWRAAIKAVLEQHLPAGWEPLTSGVDIDMTFFFAPPASARRGDLPITKSTYDIDKLARAMNDGLTEGGAIEDDARVTDLTCRKRYDWDGHGERAEVTISPSLGD